MKHFLAIKRGIVALLVVCLPLQGVLAEDWAVYAVRFREVVVQIEKNQVEFHQELGEILALMATVKKTVHEVRIEQQGISESVVNLYNRQGDVIGELRFVDNVLVETEGAMGEALQRLCSAEMAMTSLEGGLAQLSCQVGQLNCSLQQLQCALNCLSCEVGQLRKNIAIGQFKAFLVGLGLGIGIGAATGGGGPAATRLVLPALPF